jgi:hypothetical protein
MEDEGHRWAGDLRMVMSIVLCQQKKWGVDLLL